MADSEIAGLTEDTTPDSTDNIYAQSADGTTDKRVPLSALATLYQPLAAVLTNTTASFTTADETKLDGIEALADVTDAANVAAAGASMVSSGAGAPGSTPAAVGNIYVDTTADRVYVATDTASSADWDLLPVTGAQVLALLLTVDGSGSGLDADTLDGVESTSFVRDTGDETIAGVKTFSSDPIIPDEAYDATNWNGVLEPPTKNAVRDKFEALRTFEAGVRTAPDTGSAGLISIDVDLATGISGGDTLTGGSGASETLTLASTSNATRGFINLRDRTLLITEDKTYSTGTAALNLMEVQSARTITLSSATAAGNSLNCVGYFPTVIHAANTGLYSGLLFTAEPTITNDSGTTRTIGIFTPFYAKPTFQANGGTVTHSGYTFAQSAPVFTTINSGVLNTTAAVAYTSGATVNSGATVTAFTHYTLANITGAGTVTTQTGIDIPVLTAGGTNIGLLNGSTTGYTPGTATISSASSTVTASSRSGMRLNNTSGGSVTLTSTPTIADGFQGQILYLVNSSANNVVFQDESGLAGSNLRLGAATRTVKQYGTLVLWMNTTTGYWHEIGFMSL